MWAPLGSCRRSCCLVLQQRQHRAAAVAHLRTVKVDELHSSSQQGPREAAVSMSGSSARLTYGHCPGALLTLPVAPVGPWSSRECSEKSRSFLAATRPGPERGDRSVLFHAPGVRAFGLRPTPTRSPRRLVSRHRTYWLVAEGDKIQGVNELQTTTHSPRDVHVWLLRRSPILSLMVLVAPGDGWGDG